MSLAYGQGVVVRVLESPDGVTMVASGSLNVGSLHKISNVLTYAPRALPNDAEFRLGAEELDNMTDDGDVYIANFEEKVFGPQNFGGGNNTNATSGSGPVFGISSGFGDHPNLYVPNEYVSGTQFSSSAGFTGSSFSSMGLTPGTYVWEWGSRTQGESVTMLIGQEAVDNYTPYQPDRYSPAAIAAKAALERKVKKLKKKAKAAEKKGKKKKSKKLNAKLKRLVKKLIAASRPQ